MIDCNFWFKYKIMYNDEILHNGEYGLDRFDSSDYLKNALNCSIDELKKTVDNTENDEFQNIVEWVAYQCLSMDQMLSDICEQEKDEIAKNLSANILKDSDGDLDEIYEEVFYDMRSVFTSVELTIEGKKYVAK